MTDFWFVFGAMAIDPGLLDEIEKLRPRFDRIKLTLVEEVNGVIGEVPVPAAGYLDGTAVTQTREMLRDEFAMPYGVGAPIISLYTAGQICQLWNADQARLKQCMVDAHEMFVQAAQSTGLQAPYSTRMAVVMGACLIDDDLKAEITKPSQVVYAMEFGFDPSQNTREWATVQAFLYHPEFNRVQTSLLGGSSWDPQCRQRFLFYAPFMRAAN